MYKIRPISLIVLLLVLFTANLYSQIIFNVTNVTVNGGKVYLAVFFNADEFRREEPAIAFELDSTSTVLSQTVSLPPGEYVFSAFQDSNGNGELDYNFLGIPRELVGISNYSGRGFPSRNFDRQKIPVNSTTDVVTIALYRF